MEELNISQMIVYYGLISIICLIILRAIIIVLFLMLDNYLGNPTDWNKDGSDEDLMDME